MYLCTQYYLSFVYLMRITLKPDSYTHFRYPDKDIHIDCRANADREVLMFRVHMRQVLCGYQRLTAHTVPELQNILRQNSQSCTQTAYSRSHIYSGPGSIYSAETSG